MSDHRPRLDGPSAPAPSAISSTQDPAGPPDALACATPQALEAAGVPQDLASCLLQLAHENQELRRARATLEAIFINAPNVMLLVDRDARVRDINRMGVELARRGEEDLLGLLGGEVLQCLNSFDGQGCGRNQPCGQCPVRARVESTFASGQPIFNEEGGLTVLRDGQPIRLDFLVSTSPVRAGQEDMVLVSLVDISERKRQEEAVREGQAKLEAALASMTDAVFISDAQGHFIHFNDAFAAFHRFRDKGECAKTLAEYPDILDVYLPSGELAPLEQWAVPRALRGEKVNNAEYGLRRKDTGERWVGSYNFSPIRDEAGQIVGSVVVGRDITELKEAEREKARLEAQLRQAQKMEAIGTLAGGIAHDFNNILGTILGYAEMAKDDLETGAVNPQDLGQIITAVARAKDLIRQILTFSRKSPLSFTPLDLNHKVAEVAHMLNRMLPKEIALETRLEAALPRINGDAGQLDQVLLNLAANARDAMPEGGRLSLETRRVSLGEEFCRRYMEVRPGDYVLLQVTDNGQGMDQTTLEHMYDPFFTTKAVGKGTGLGLSTIHGIVKSHGGHIFCESALGQGTTFSVYLPALDHEQPGPAPENPAPPAEPRGGGQGVLLVDDDESLRLLGSRTLQAAGYQVEAVASGEDALETYGRQGADLVVLDLGMPGMGGLKCLKALLLMDPQAKVLIASGYAADLQVKEALQAGAIGYVAKPFRRAELLATVKKMLEEDPGPAA